jgi:hypothetical protein
MSLHRETWRISRDGGLVLASKKGKRCKYSMKRLTMTLVIGVALGTFCIASHAPAVEDVSVFCYVGNPDDNDYLGTVDVFDTRAAAADCNMIYNDCYNNCTGCFADEDSRDVCVDSSGRGYYH